LKIVITQETGHAHVGAIRVLHYRTGRPPTLEEVAELLGSTVEVTNHRLRALEAIGAVTIVENPFEAHVSVANHRALEELPEEADEEGLADAVEDFKRRQVEKADEMMRAFEEDDEGAEKKKRHDRIEKELKTFKKKPTKKAPWES